MLDLLLPTDCAGCGASGGQLCADCRHLLGTLRGRPLGPRPVPPGLPVPHSAGWYADPVRRLLLAHKERGALPLAGPLGAVLARAVRSAVTPAVTPAAGADLPGPLLLVPMPSTRRAVRARGHDATLRLARAAARELGRTGLPCRVAPVLRPTRRIADQSGLGAAERRRNLHGALTVPTRLRSRLAGLRPVLVDDLVTTGATLAEAARALGAAGAPPLAAATVAATAADRADQADRAGRAGG
ncbi:ComF family protein [Kitasatospora sp. NPDC052896]|uniref:ComF family protein n=1 Tax=Kitasatospora sp. NPDC052896 TaxID=3364061 RepID=UPI0037C7512B